MRSPPAGTATQLPLAFSTSNGWPPAKTWAISSAIVSMASQSDWSWALGARWTNARCTPTSSVSAPSVTRFAALPASISPMPRMVITIC